MGFQYNEFYNANTGLTVGIKKVLFSEQSPYQRVAVYETDTWGNMMTIDDIVMLSEKDEFVYHEMISHVGMFAHPNPKRVLIIGGGDGGTAREVMKHKSVERVDMVEIDEAVVRASKLHMPAVGDFDNPKLNVIYEDGINFVKNVTEPYDVIIIDGSDPVGPAQVLFKHEFYQSCYKALSANGVLTAQSESPFEEKYRFGQQAIYKSLRDIFAVSKMYLAFIPLYPTGMWSLAFASKGIDPCSEEVLSRVDEGMKAFGSTLKYYNKSLQTGAFAVPNFALDIIK